MERFYCDEEKETSESEQVHVKINIPLLTFSTVVLPFFGHADRCKYLMLNLSSSTRRLWQTSCEKMINNYVLRRKLHDSRIKESSVNKYIKSPYSCIQTLQLYIDQIDSIYLRLLPGIEIITLKEYNKLFELFQNPKGKYINFDFIKLHIFSDFDDKCKKLPTIREEYTKLISLMQDLGLSTDCLQEVDPMCFNSVKGITQVNHLSIEIEWCFFRFQEALKTQLKFCNVQCATLAISLTDRSGKYSNDKLLNSLLQEEEEENLTQNNTGQDIDIFPKILKESQLFENLIIRNELSLDTKRLKLEELKIVISQIPKIKSIKLQNLEISDISFLSERMLQMRNSNVLIQASTIQSFEFVNSPSKEEITIRMNCQKRCTIGVVNFEFLSIKFYKAKYCELSTDSINNIDDGFNSVLFVKNVSHFLIQGDLQNCEDEVFEHEVQILLYLETIKEFIYNPTNCFVVQLLNKYYSLFFRF